MEKKGKKMRRGEDCQIGWRATFMCLKLLCQVVHEIRFLRTSDRETKIYTRETSNVFYGNVKKLKVNYHGSFIE
jgi:DNA-binding LytR/AlgR family response regulator